MKINPKDFKYTSYDITIGETETKSLAIHVSPALDSMVYHIKTAGSDTIEICSTFADAIKAYNSK